MQTRISMAARVRRAALGATLFGAFGIGAAGCKNDVAITNPNASSPGNQSVADVNANTVAAYNALLGRGLFQRWQAFAYDMRSDEGTSTSPWPELQAFVKFQFPSDYDFEVNREIWNDSYVLVSRANLVVNNGPSATGDAAAKARLVGEGKFLRGLAYFHLITLYGGKIPLITTPLGVNDRPAGSDSATVWAQIEKDFTEAAAVLPVQTMSQSGGRATKGAAQGMLAKTLLQERKWAAASTALDPIIAKQVGNYNLVANYASLFTNAGNNTDESLFEVQMGNQSLASSQGVGGLNVAKMVGACGPGYCDGLPTRWFADQFRIDPTVSGGVDPRLDATLFYYKGDTTRVYGRTWGGWRDSTDQRAKYTNPNTIYFKKYGEYYTGSTDQNWDAQLNYKVLRYADVLLMKAEALNEQGQPGAAVPLVNQVRARVNVRPVAGAPSQATMRDIILKERLLEFGLEGQRWLDLGRQNLFTTDLVGLKARDPDFNNFVPGRQLLPITQSERNLNPGLAQNPSY